jgi:hypothetical protein
MQQQLLALPNYSSLGTVREGWGNGEVHDALIAAGWEELGSGCFCTAYLSPNGDRVLKIGRGHGARATIEAALANSDNPHLPKVYGFLPLSDSTYGDFAVECEVLEPFDDDEEEWDDNEGEYVHPAFAAWSSRWHPRELQTYPSLFKGRRNGPMKDAIRALIAAKKVHGGSWDAHSGNVMVRPSTGELVLNDLIA